MVGGFRQDSRHRKRVELPFLLGSLLVDLSRKQAECVDDHLIWGFVLKRRIIGYLAWEEGCRFYHELSRFPWNAMEIGSPLVYHVRDFGFGAALLEHAENRSFCHRRFWSVPARLLKTAPERFFPRGE